jgi:ketosteroid isomerase-like protein
VGNKRYISELSNSVIDELSDDVVVITSLNKISIIENHRTDIASGRLSIVLRKNEGTWKIAHFHRSAMPE